MIIEVPYKELAKLLKAKVSMEKVRETLDMFGTPVDDFDKDNIRVEVNPNRMDMLSPEGIARSLNGFLGAELGYPVWSLLPSGIETTVQKSKVRPFVSFASVKKVPFDDVALQSLMQMQEKLHTSLGRNRRKYSIGVYDADKVGKKITFKDMPLKEIEFIPLGEKSTMNGKEILESTDKGKKFGHLIKGDIAPVLLDSQNRIMSMAPIINAEYCKVTANTKNFFIDSTGTSDGTDSVVSLVSTSLAERGGDIGITLPGPSYLPKRMKISRHYINSLIGVNFDSKHIKDHLAKMRLGFDGDILVPPYRLDIFSDIDIAEEIAISYGYEKFAGELLPSYTPGQPLYKREFENKVRQIMIGLGFLELKTFLLTNPDLLNLAGEHKVEVSNPKSSEYSALRQSLLPGLFNVLANNTHSGYPQGVFEIGPVFLPKERVRISGIAAHPTASYVEIKGAIDRISMLLGIEPKWVPGKHPFFMEGRTAESEYGVFGEVNLDVAQKISMPMAAFELSLDKIL